jgi:hypothetical protein
LGGHSAPRPARKLNGAGNLALMPSNEHITVAYDRDYEDVSPVSGILLGGSRLTMKVEVDVAVVA